MKQVARASIILTEYIRLWMVKHLLFFQQCRNNRPYTKAAPKGTGADEACSRGCHVRMFQMLRTLKQILYCDPNDSFKKRKCFVRCQITIVLIFSRGNLLGSCLENHQFKIFSCSKERKKR